ncbi:MAG: P-loop NTPase [Thermoprotei archaeon]|nr:P-loop NTPase [Thermoprotei archaeon]
MRIESLDPRISVISRRFANVRKIIAVMSGKGGVGKTLVATTSALILAKEGHKVGLLDLDMHGPSCHIVLNVQALMPREEKGIIPPQVHGVRFMSIEYYARGSPLPLRGSEVSNAILELLAITRWPSLDYLIIDMPPGTGDEVLDLLWLVKRSEALIICTPSKLALSTVRRLAVLLKSLGAPILGIIENMRTEATSLITELAEESGIRYLGWTPYDPNVEKCIGDPRKLLMTDFAKKLAEIVMSSMR